MASKPKSTTTTLSPQRRTRRGGKKTELLPSASEEGTVVTTDEETPTERRRERDRQPQATIDKTVSSSSKPQQAPHLPRNPSPSRRVQQQQQSRPSLAAPSNNGSTSTHQSNHTKSTCDSAKAKNKTQRLESPPPRQRRPSLLGAVAPNPACFADRPQSTKAEDGTRSDRYDSPGRRSGRRPSLLGGACPSPSSFVGDSATSTSPRRKRLAANAKVPSATSLDDNENEMPSSQSSSPRRRSLSPQRRSRSPGRKPSRAQQSSDNTHSPTGTEQSPTTQPGTPRRRSRVQQRRLSASSLPASHIDACIEEVYVSPPPPPPPPTLHQSSSEDSSALPEQACKKQHRHHHKLHKSTSGSSTSKNNSSKSLGASAPLDSLEKLAHLAAGDSAMDSYLTKVKARRRNSLQNSVAADGASAHKLATTTCPVSARVVPRRPSLTLNVDTIGKPQSISLELGHTEFSPLKKKRQSSVANLIYPDDEDTDDEDKVVEQGYQSKNSAMLGDGNGDGTGHPQRRRSLSPKRAPKTPKPSGSKNHHRRSPASAPADGNADRLLKVVDGIRPIPKSPNTTANDLSRSQKFSYHVDAHLLSKDSHREAESGDKSGENISFREKVQRRRSLSRVEQLKKEVHQTVVGSRRSSMEHSNSKSLKGLEKLGGRRDSHARDLEVASCAPRTSSSSSINNIELARSKSQPKLRAASRSNSQSQDLECSSVAMSVNPTPRRSRTRSSGRQAALLQQQQQQAASMGGAALSSEALPPRPCSQLRRHNSNGAAIRVMVAQKEALSAAAANMYSGKQQTPGEPTGPPAASSINGKPPTRRSSQRTNSKSSSRSVQHVDSDNSTVVSNRRSSSSRRLGSTRASENSSAMGKTHEEPSSSRKSKSSSSLSGLGSSSSSLGSKMPSSIPRTKSSKSLSHHLTQNESVLEDEPSSPKSKRDKSLKRLPSDDGGIVAG